MMEPSSLTRLLDTRLVWRVELRLKHIDIEKIRFTKQLEWGVELQVLHLSEQHQGCDKFPFIVLARIENNSQREVCLQNTECTV
jgi:hypothetical protein